MSLKNYQGGMSQLGRDIAALALHEQEEFLNEYSRALSTNALLPAASKQLLLAKRLACASGYIKNASTDMYFAKKLNKETP